jgi:histone-lysine N-methyltransferase SUV420H
MPPKAVDLEEALRKKGGLTLSQLANYDDLLTDTLVDRVSLQVVERAVKITHAC